MQVAALYDIHGNLPALKAVLRDIRQAEVDLIVVGGDVFPGPMPLSEDFAAQNVVHPPSELQALEAFAQAELK
jgi:Icc-related predicted phosphoesterase